MAILGVFGKLCFSPFLVTKTQMCLTGSITSENKGGGGSDPLRKKSIVNLLFFPDGFPNTLKTLSRFCPVSPRSPTVILPVHLTFCSWKSHPALTLHTYVTPATRVQHDGRDTLGQTISVTQFSLAFHCWGKNRALFLLA